MSSILRLIFDLKNRGCQNERVDRWYFLGVQISLLKISPKRVSRSCLVKTLHLFLVIVGGSARASNECFPIILMFFDSTYIMSCPHLYSSSILCYDKIILAEIWSITDILNVQ